MEESKTLPMVGAVTAVGGMVAGKTSVWEHGCQGQAWGDSNDNSRPGKTDELDLKNGAFFSVNS